MSSAKKKLTIIFTIIIGMLILALIGLHRKAAHKPLLKKPQINGAVLPTPKIIRAFHFTQFQDNQVHSFTQVNLKNHWTWMFFGFSNCALVCPTTMAKLARAYEILQHTQWPNALLPQVVMVSVDPQRDTAKRMQAYATSFNKTFIGIRSNVAETKALANQMSVTYKIIKKSEDDEHYMVSHSATMMLLNPEGHLVAFFDYELPDNTTVSSSMETMAQTLAKSYKAIIRYEQSKS